jgi:Histidine kinase-, DNA gyrase B-, and HSP90-like ATPase
VGETFKGEIKVASRIVDYLSSGLYNSPAACLKELVNNSYDADATTVTVLVKPDANRIVVSDDGVGLSREEFERHFQRISESHKRDDTDVTESGRPKVGKIGIGFIAANELCDVMEIISTKKGSTDLLRVEVNFNEMRLDRSERARDGDTYAKGDYVGWVESAESSEHYTHVLLKDVRGYAHDIFIGVPEGSDDTAEDRTAGGMSVYGRKPEYIRDLLVDRVTDWSDLDAYSQTMLRVGMNVPVRYLPKWHGEVKGGGLSKLTREVEGLEFKVLYDGTDLRKPVVLPPSPDGHVLRKFSYDGEHVAAHGYLYAGVGVLRPEWLNGVMIRIRNAAVGEYDDGFLGFRHSEGTLFQRWMTAELWADDRLEEALNIDRRTLRITHPAFVELQRAFHEELSSFLTEVRAELYQTRSTERRRSKARDEVTRLRTAIERPAVRLPKATKKALDRREAAVDGASQAELRSLLKSYSVSELYTVALEVAEEVLTPDQYRRFAAALAQRLLD